MPSEVEELLAGAARYKPTGVVRAHRLDTALTWHDDHGTALRAVAGDWQLTGPDGGRWTVDPDSFARTYRRLPDGRYAKHERVDAVRVEHAVDVATREGTATARPGDWLLRDAAGAVWPVPDATFRARYRPAGSSAASGSGPGSAPGSGSSDGSGGATRSM